MKLVINEDGNIQLEKVFSGLTLKTESGETMSIAMKDTGFEFIYQGKIYFAKEGRVDSFSNLSNERKFLKRCIYCNSYNRKL